MTIISDLRQCHFTDYISNRTYTARKVTREHRQARTQTKKQEHTHTHTLRHSAIQFISFHLLV